MQSNDKPIYHIDTNIYQGRPTDGSTRLDKELQTYNLLDKLNISYTRVDHDPLPTIEACAEIDQLLNIDICKNLFLCNKQETDFYLLILSGDKKYKAGVVSKQIDSSRLSFAHPHYMEEMMDITPGSVSVLGLMNDTDNRIRLLIDKDLFTQEYFGCHPCINTSSIKMKTSDLIKKVLPAIKHSYTIVDLSYKS